MLNRRSFLRTSLSGAVAVATGTRWGQVGTQLVPTKLSLQIKGQALFVVPKTSDERMVIACLQTEPGDTPHDGWLYLSRSAVQLEGSLKPTDDSLAQWLGWRLSKTHLSLPDVRLLGNGLLRTPPPKSSSTPWPQPPDDPRAWSSRSWIADARLISPTSSLVKDWRTYCEWTLELPAGTLEARKPCKVRDISAVWRWRDKSGVRDTRSVTDIVAYNSLQFDGRAQIQLTGGVINLAGALVEGWILCSPPPSGAAPAAYVPGDKIAHFARFYRVLTNPSRAEMVFERTSAPPQSLTVGVCPQPVVVRDDDIFCPGMQVFL